MAASLEVGNSHLIVQAIWRQNANHWRAVTRPGWDAQVVITCLPKIPQFAAGKHNGPRIAPSGAVIARLFCATVNSARLAQTGSRQQRIVEGHRPLVYLG
jgi:hypothetical protein